MTAVAAMVSPRGAAQKDELRRQRDLLIREAPVRFGAALLAYALSAMFLSWPVPLACAVATVAGEWLNLRLLRGLDPAQQPLRHAAMLASEVWLGLVFLLPPALIWHLDGPYAKAFAVGMAATTLLHVVTVRAIYLPMGLASLVAVSGAVFVSNSLFWLHMHDYQALSLTSFSALVTLAYALTAMIHTHILHRDATADRAQAQAANAAKGQFLAQMSHELRTPLNAILGMGHAEAQSTTDPAAKARMQVLIAAASGLSVMLDDILDLSAMQEGRMQIRPVAADPAAEIAATVALFRPSYEAAGLQLRLEGTQDLPTLAAFDPQRLRQCLSNLVSNALKYTAQGGVLLRAQHDPTGPLLRLFVADTGPGITPGQRATIFEPFQRGDAARAGDGGRGLGLAVCRALARQMGGDLVLAPPDAPDLPALLAGSWPQGACFVLTIALPAVSAPAPPPRTAPPAHHSGRRVLCVDDIATNRLVALTYLRLLGASGIEAASGAAALDLLVRAPVDLVLLDLQMPGLDGAATLQRIRALPDPAGRVPVVALTADAGAAQRAACLAQGFDGYLAKPITPAALAAELTRLLPPPAITG